MKLSNTAGWIISILLVFIFPMMLGLLVGVGLGAPPFAAFFCALVASGIMFLEMLMGSMT